MKPAGSRSGLLYAIAIISLWTIHLLYALACVPTAPSAETSSVLMIPRVLLHVLIQTYLYTGLFITAHDAMHGTVHPNKKLNRLIGRISALLFAAFSYRRLHANHMKHHRWPGEERDPDFCTRSQNFFVWFVTFFLHYATVLQILIMAAVFNLLKLIFPVVGIILFWIVPAFLATFQLFYFGTYRPHRYPHTDAMRPHNARTQKRNHLRAMLSCYFFGYHHEHHESPGTPWWRLYQLK